jgi:hypothetical protein
MKNAIKKLIYWLLTPVRKLKELWLRYRVHIVYALIIANLVIWANAYVTGSRWYNDYIDLSVAGASAHVTEGAESSPAPSVGSKEWVLWYVEKEGIDPVKVNCLITHESGWNPNNKHVNSANSIDLGLYQWSSKYQMDPGYITMACIGNVECETYKFVEKVKQDQNFGAWHGYSNKCLWLGTDPFIKK